MGQLVSQGVHYRASAANPGCDPLIVTHDNPPNYDTINGLQITSGIQPGSLIGTIRTDLTMANVDPDTGREDGTVQPTTWHYGYQCRDA